MHQLRRYVESDERLGDLLDMDADFGIGRKGNGVKVMLPVGGTWKFFSRDLARDLVERLEDQIPT